MIKLLIADDEPLVQIGIKSMISWESLGIEICGTASNGDAAYEMICSHRPEIVLTDIQMPCSSGLELGKRCREEFGELPLFIILTNYEDFNYAREAISFRAFDYLVKIDLSPESLTEAMKRAVGQVRRLRSAAAGSSSGSAAELQLLQDRFFIRLLYNLFETDAQYERLVKELRIPADFAGYSVAHIAVLPPAMEEQLPEEQVLRLYSSTRQMFQELAAKHLPCRMIALDIRHMAVVFYFSGEHLPVWKEQVAETLAHAFEMLFNYYSVRFYACIGRCVDKLQELPTSYHDAKQMVNEVSESRPILYWDEFCGFLPDYTKRHKNYLVENTKKYILEHLHERIVLQDIADNFGVSPNYLSQLFKRFEQVGISEYISSLKIRKAKELLKDGNLKIYEVADRLGFESAFYFSKVFKKTTGIAPKDFRNL